jgi:hypothetical protein
MWQRLLEPAAIGSGDLLLAGERAMLELGQRLARGSRGRCRLALLTRGRRATPIDLRTGLDTVCPQAPARTTIDDTSSAVTEKTDEFTRKDSGEVAGVKTGRLVYTVQDGKIVRYELESLDDAAD